MFSDLRISYSGVRGIVGTALTPDVARSFGQAFRELLLSRHDRPTLVLARDTRPSGPDICAGLIEGLGDLERYDLGIVPTPTAQFATAHLGAQGAVVVTASHNPIAWNGFKFMLSPPATVLDGPQTKELMARMAELKTPPAGQGKTHDRHDELVAAHREAVLGCVDAERIRARKFRVAYDSAQGAGQESTLALLHSLGCEVFNVTEPRESEPLPAHLGPLCEAVKANRADLGVAQDLDADRLALVTEEGRAPGEHLSLVLVLEHLLKRFEGPCVVVKNLSTTRAVDDLAQRAGARLVEVPVGEVNLSRALEREQAAGHVAFGGEGNGGVIYPQVSLGRDSLVGLAFVLETLASREEPLSQRLQALPAYLERQVKLPAGPALDMACQALLRAFPEATPTQVDGLKLNFDDAWLGLRASNTEPIWRLSAEARHAARIDELLAKAKAAL